MNTPPPKQHSNVLPIILTVILSMIVLILAGTAILLGLVRHALRMQYGDPSRKADASSVTETMTEPQIDETRFILESVEEPTAAVPETEVPTAEAPVQTETVPDDEEEAWVQYYQQMLDQFCASSSDPENVRFDLLDLDDDGIPELFLSEGEYHLAHVLMYSYFDGFGRQIEGIYGSYGDVLYDVNNGLLIDTDMSQGYYYRIDYQYYHGELTAVFSCSDNEGAVENEFERQYMLNGEAVSADVYYAEMDRRSLDDAISLGREFSPYGEE